MTLIRVALLLLFVALWGFAIEFPPVRNPNLVTIHILPEEFGKEVTLEFDKRDVNGYVGTDAIVLSVVSPSGKTVCEVALPDDGNDKNNWSLGPRQRVVLRFLADEKGEYVVNSNSFSSVDIAYAFDQATATNAAWGVEIKKPRFLHGKLHVFMVAAPRHIGERQELVLLVENGKWTSLSEFQCSENGMPLMEPYTHRTKTEKRLDDLRFPIRRQSREGIIEIQARIFAECAWTFAGYPDFILCTELSHAQVFRRYFSDLYYTGTSVEFPTPQPADSLAFAPCNTYRATFIPSPETPSFQFAFSVLGEKHTIAPGSESFEFTMPEENAYAECDWSTAPKGKILIQKITRKPEIIQPESGILWNKNTPALTWTPVAGITAYTVTLTHLDSGRKVTVPVKTNSLGWGAFVSRLSPGVWKWQVASNGKVASPDDGRFFIIPQRGKTSPGYLWGHQPAMDSLQKEMPSALFIRLMGKPLSEIDWKGTFWSVNGKSLEAKAGSEDRIEAVLTPGVFRNGRNVVQLTVVDRLGNLQENAWNFDVAIASERTMEHDAQGRIQFNGRPFYPIIYYGYFGKKFPIEKLGFNVLLTNGFSSQPQLDNMLSRNLKVLDAGCSFKDSPMEKVREYAANQPLIRHPARFGMWCDEMDVHRSLEWIRDYVAIFNGKDAWRGICSCNLSLYGKMSEYGDYLLIDSYVYKHERLFHIDDVFAKARRAAGGKPLLAILCGFSNEDPKLVGFTPSVKDVEYQLYAALRHGVNGAGLYQCGPYRMEGYPAIWSQATEMMKRFSAITFIAALDDATSAVRVTASEGKPLYRAFRKGKRLWLVLQNGSFAPGLFRVEIAGASATPVKVLFEERIIRSAGGVFSDAFTEAGTHLYLIEMK